MRSEGLVRNVCVIGAGTMGSGIAAHLANLGFRVTLLDQSQDAVIDAFDRAKSAKPPHFFLPETANEVRLGNIHEHLSYVGEADWVIEAIVERSDAKQALYDLIEPVLHPEAFISTNTSGLQIDLLIRDRSPSFRRRFVGTHFFNPPRYLKLVELIPTQETDPEVVSALVNLLEKGCGKRVIQTKDTPGFIANRYGMWCMFRAIHVAERLQLSVEEVDLITGKFLGRPKSGSFRLNDVVGLDVMRDIATNLIERCPADPQISTLQQPTSMHALLARNWIGEKVGQGYYRREGKEFLALELTTMAYRYVRDVSFKSINDLSQQPLAKRIPAALDLRDPVGEFLREYLVPALRYANSLKEEISHCVSDFDRVMEWGFGWEMGPFAMIDAIGAERLGISEQKFYDDGKQRSFAGTLIAIPNDPEYRQLSDFPVLDETETLCIRDLGDGVKSVGSKTKLGVISLRLVEELTALLEKGSLGRFVLTSEGPQFSAGFDIKFLHAQMTAKNYAAIDEELQRLQRLGELLGKSTGVAAVRGFCLGAGLELALSCAHIVAHSESQIGLPEAKLGLIPGGRGTVLTRLNNQANSKRLSEVALTLTRGEVAANADMARELGYLRLSDQTIYHPDRLITAAKTAALAASVAEPLAWGSETAQLVGMIDRALEMAQERSLLTEYDVAIGQKIKAVFARSKDVADAVNRERQEFIDLCGKPFTEARLRHMIETGKPLRN